MTGQHGARPHTARTPQQGTRAITRRRGTQGNAVYVSLSRKISAPLQRESPAQGRHHGCEFVQSSSLCVLIHWILQIHSYRFILTDSFLQIHSDRIVLSSGGNAELTMPAGSPVAFMAVVLLRLRMTALAVSPASIPPASSDMT